MAVRLLLAPALPVEMFGALSLVDPLASYVNIIGFGPRTVVARNVAIYDGSASIPGCRARRQDYRRRWISECEPQIHICRGLRAIVILLYITVIYKNDGPSENNWLRMG
jgi:hypothetical protein